MAIDEVRAFFRERGMEGRILELNETTATVALAAEALGCAEARIAKTLAFDVKGKTVLIVAAGDARIDNARFKAAFGTKAKMIPAADTERRTGHAPGGVCPFAVAEDAEVKLDTSLRRFNSVFPACGSANSAIELTIDELAELTAPAEWISACRIPGE